MFMLLIRLYDMSKPCIHTPQFTVLLVSFLVCSLYLRFPIPLNLSHGFCSSCKH